MQNLELKKNEDRAIINIVKTPHPSKSGYILLGYATVVLKYCGITIRNVEIYTDSTNQTKFRMPFAFRKDKEGNFVKDEKGYRIRDEYAYPNTKESREYIEFLIDQELESEETVEKLQELFAKIEE